MDEELNDSARNDDESSEQQESENKSAISSDLIRGHINTIILRTLYERDKYGYEIIEEIEAKSHGQYSLKQPTLYSALKRLESQGYINAYWKTDEVSQGGRRKYYTLTDSGREITERNQAEWEYSRTVIDSLISDKNFDFSQPAPTPVDFKILKVTTSRVPVPKEDDADSGREVVYDEPETSQVVEIVNRPATETVITPAENNGSEPDGGEPQPESSVQTAETQPEQQTAEIQPEEFVDEVAEETVVEQAPETPADDEERRRAHENYLRLISEPVQPTAPEPEDQPYADGMETDGLIYISKPEAERDYKNIVNNLYARTFRPAAATAPAAETAHARPAAPASPKPAPVTNVRTVRVNDADAMTDKDDLAVGTSVYEGTGTRRKRYNRGATMFKCSLIIFVVMMLEFALCLIFRDDLGVDLTYGFVIFAIACAQLLLFGVLCYTDIGKSSRKPTSLVYVTASIITAIFAVLIIFVVSFILNVNFNSAGDIMAKIVIPCFVALNIPAFAGIFYLMSK